LSGAFGTFGGPKVQRANELLRSGVMEVITALIHVLDITTRNKPHKDPETSSG